MLPLIRIMMVGASAAKLAVPTTMTPPVRVERVRGAPSSWAMSKKVAEALRQRDIPAGTSTKGSTVYILKGQVKRAGSRKSGSQVAVAWSLYAPNGKKVGQVTQVASIPAKANDDVVEAIADAAAESITPIIPSTKLEVAESTTTGEPVAKSRREFEAKNPVTAIGKLKTGKSGISRNLEAHSKSGKSKSGTILSKARASGELTGGRAADTAATGDSKAATAIGRMGRGRSVLSRNLVRGTYGRAKLSIPPSDSRLVPPKTAIASRTDGRTSRGRVSPGRSTESAINDAAKDPAGGITSRKTAETPTGARTKLNKINPAAGSATIKPAKGIALTEVYFDRRIRSRIRARSLAKLAPRSGSTIDRSVKTEIGLTSRTAARKSAGSTDRLVTRGRMASRTTGPSRRSGRLAFWVQVGSYRSAAASEAVWQKTRAKAPNLLGDKAHNIKRAVVGDRGVFYRIHVGPYRSMRAAGSLCRNLKAAAVDCFIMPERLARPAGRSVGESKGNSKPSAG